MKRILLAIVAIFVVWSALDFVVHGIILASAYAATSQLWRPMAEMKTGLMHVTILITATSFVMIYARLITDKSVKNGLLLGAFYGISAGVSMGYGSYSVMPITYNIALVWFLGCLVEALVAGWITAVIVKKER